MEVKSAHIEVKKVDSSIFMDKDVKPTETELIHGLGKSYEIWKEICQIVLEHYPAGLSEWTFPGRKYGWNFRIKDNKRAIVYLLPRDHFFIVGFVFGFKAYETILNTDVSQEIKKRLKIAKVYAEGRAVRLDVKNRNKIKDITRLIEIKLAV